MPTLKTLVDDYQQSKADARDPEVLLLFSTMMKCMGLALSGFLESILSGLCQSTLEMIKADTASYPEFRSAFFKLIENIIKHCT